MSNEISPTPAGAPAATPTASDPANASNGTANSTATQTVSDATQTNGTQTAPDGDTFTSVDVNSLPPELKAKYDSMLSDYKRKTSDIAERRKQMDSLEQKAKAYDQVSSDPAFVNYWNGLTKTQQAQAKEEAGISDQEFNQAFESKENFSQFIQKVAQVSTQQSQQEITNLKADLMIKDFKSRHTDFEQLNEDRMIEVQIKADPRTYTNDPKQWEKALTDAVTHARAVRSKFIEMGRKEGLSRVQEKVSQSTNPPTASPEQIYPGGDAAKLSVSEALDLARRGIKVPRK